MGIAERWTRFAPLPPNVDELIDALIPLFEREGVEVAYLFGSLVSCDRAANDVDLAVLAPEMSTFDLWQAITRSLGTERVDLVDLHLASPVLRFAIISGGRVLYAADPDIRRGFELATLTLYHDTAFLRDRQRRWLRQRMAAWQRGGDSMVVKRETIEQQLQDLDEILQELNKHKAVTQETLTEDLTLRWALERGLIAAAEVVFDVANHILSAHFAAYPESYEDGLRLLAEKQVISRALYERIQGFGGFRNVLVHRYRTIKLDVVLTNFQESLEVLPDFATDVLAWLDGVTGPPQPSA